MYKVQNIFATEVLFRGVSHKISDCVKLQMYYECPASRSEYKSVTTVCTRTSSLFKQRKEEEEEGKRTKKTTPSINLYSTYIFLFAGWIRSRTRDKNTSDAICEVESKHKP